LKKAFLVINYRENDKGEYEPCESYECLEWLDDKDKELKKDPLKVKILANIWELLKTTDEKIDFTLNYNPVFDEKFFHKIYRILEVFHENHITFWILEEILKINLKIEDIDHLFTVSKNKKIKLSPEEYKEIFLNFLKTSNYEEIDLALWIKEKAKENPELKKAKTILNKFHWPTKKWQLIEFLKKHLAFKNLKSWSRHLHIRHKNCRFELAVPWHLNSEDISSGKLNFFKKEIIWQFKKAIKRGYSIWNFINKPHWKLQPTSPILQSE